jgi:hypothetical protein
LADTLFTVRRRTEGVSSDYLRVLDHMEAVLRPLWQDLQARGEWSEARAKALAEATCRAGHHYLERREGEKADRCFELAREMHAGGGLTQFHPLRRLLCRLAGPSTALRMARRLRR